MLNMTEYCGVIVCVTPEGLTPEDCKRHNMTVVGRKVLTKIVNDVYRLIARDLDERYERHLRDIEIVSRLNENLARREEFLQILELDYALERMDLRSKAEQVLTYEEIGYLF